MCVFLSSVSHIFLLTAFSVLTVILLSLMPDSLVLCLILCNSRLYPQFIPSPPLFSYRYAFFLFGHSSYISKSSSFLLWVLPGCPAWQSLSFPLQRCWGKSHQTHSNVQLDAWQCALFWSFQLHPFPHNSFPYRIFRHLLPAGSSHQHLHLVTVCVCCPQMLYPVLSCLCGKQSWSLVVKYSFSQDSLHKTDIHHEVHKGLSSKNCS